MKNKWASLGATAAAVAATLGLTAPASSAVSTDSASASQPAGKSSNPSPERPRIISPIVGGSQVPNDAYPFMAALLNKQTPGGALKKQFCAGTLYQPDVILTAAHCVAHLEPEDVRVAVGRTVLSDSKQGQVRQAVSFQVHPSYDQEEISTRPGYDMALIELDKPVKGITTVQLPTPGTDALIRPGAQAVAAGWGMTDDILEHSPDRLRQVTIPILSQAECKTSYGSDQFNAKTDICAGSMGKASCSGDSGGPLLRKVPGREEPIQIGIVSRGGEECASQGTPGIYTSLSSKKLWDSFV
ncbi:S1 family peptidase [Streptomyces sp. BA2]|uniref:S1 family peptidase n=1 Tax=Streptomyces sp. BA2 TaxID=436595 RepID=UPI0023514B62|nr:serine protease [Streptomyces sp. BA2]